MSDVAHDMLIPDEMATIHAAMIDRFCWFEHVGRFDRYQSYRTGGINLATPTATTKRPSFPNNRSAPFLAESYACARLTRSTRFRTGAIGNSEWLSETTIFRLQSDLIAPTVQP
jgi:hypothetical protein